MELFSCVRITSLRSASSFREDDEVLDTSHASSRLRLGLLGILQISYVIT